MEINRTAVVKLSVPDDRRGDLKQTMDTFRDAAQRFVNRGWEGNDDGYVITSRSRVQSLVYDDIRDDTGLHSDLCVGAANHASAALRGAVEQIKDGENDDPVSKPVFTSNTTVYNTNAISYFNGYCTLAAYGSGRVKAECVYPDDSIQADYMESDEWEKQGAKLRYDTQTDIYYLHVSVVKEREEVSSEAGGQTVLGVDRNVDGYLAVTSSGAFIGNADLFNHKRGEYERRRGNLQQQGTRSAHLTIQSIGDRFANWSEDYLHQVSKRVVSEAVANDCDTIVLEDLEQIRDRISNASKFQQWAFRELGRQITYKGKAEGITVEVVNPAYTSQQCSHSECGFTHKQNRDGDVFKCQKCSKELHSDYNAARNIAMKYLQDRRKSDLGGATNHLALKSGTLNGSGDLTPTASRG
ncbi:RNA-guided endonuclease InsQ/TnpB family protein [Halonotius pteroides]|uniref:Transposase n=1 Tax=Halonotius pteroides TaxID=268735 RepID=A0A3A6QDI2_9EURY|nr:RNA-guided endonuclease TnpB family protein [Halonotius pteroides]RJX49374.1 transposase [Halonotius pteroides]